MGYRHHGNNHHAVSVVAKKAAKKRGPGRPTKRTAAVEGLILKALAVGCSFDNAAWFAEVEPETLRRWRKEDPSFMGACEKARATATFKVASGLWSRAVNKGDNTAGIFYLKTRAPEFRENKGAEDEAPLASDVDIWRTMMAAIPGRELPPEIDEGEC